MQVYKPYMRKKGRGAFIIEGVFIKINTVLYLATAMNPDLKIWAQLFKTNDVVS